MKHIQFKEWLQLSVIGELNNDERQLLDIHLRGCSECSSELEELKKFQSVIVRQKPVEVTERLLQEARQQLRKALLQERLQKSLWQRLIDPVRELVEQEYKVAFGGIALSALGVLLGYIIFSAPQKSEDKVVHVEQPVIQQAVQIPSEKESFTQGNTRTSNVQIIGSGSNDGIVEFTFDAVTPMHVRGSINDDKVQKVLARALVSEDNAGVRLRTVSAMASQSPENRVSDPEVKSALISALEGDQNPGVRQEALRALLRYTIDSEIKQALVYALQHDKNSGMRIAAINGLAAASMEGHHLDQDILNILKQKIDSDKNNYVRRQARTVVEEVAHR